VSVDHMNAAIVRLLIPKIHNVPFGRRQRRFLTVGGCGKHDGPRSDHRAQAVVSNNERGLYLIAQGSLHAAFHRIFCDFDLIFHGIL
jgi:hypothetical protein